jgi:hypothetical protein
MTYRTYQSLVPLAPVPILASEAPPQTFAFMYGRGAIIFSLLLALLLDDVGAA